MRRDVGPSEMWVTVFGAGATAAISRTLSALSPACVCMQGATAHLPISDRKRLFAEASNSHRASRLYTYLPQALQRPLQRCCSRRCSDAPAAKALRRFVSGVSRNLGTPPLAHLLPKTR